MAFVDQGKTDAVKKYPKVKCHGCSMVNAHLLSELKVVSEDAKKIIMSDKRRERK